jgi:KipI family sensor histidine kinase inhibitor
MQFLDYGERAFFCKEGYVGMSPPLELTLQKATQLGLQEWVSGYDKLLLICDSPKSVPRLKDYVLQHVAAFIKGEEDTLSAVIEVPVSYQGPDLQRVARQLDLSTQELVDLHKAPEYRVQTMGFMPGFPYLSGLDSRLHLNRMASPREYVPAGSVAIGGVHAGIYPVASPGGWHLLGQTDFPLFDTRAARQSASDSREVFALHVGDRVRFVAID